MRASLRLSGLTEVSRMRVCGCFPANCRLRAQQSFEPELRLNRVLLPTRSGALQGLWNGVDRVLRLGRVVAIGRGHVLKPALEANDGDCRVAHAGEVAPRVARMRPAAVLAVCSVGNVVKAVLNLPVLADDAEQHAGIGPVPVERGQALGGDFGYCPGFDAFDRSADPDGLLSSVEIAATVPFGGRQLDTRVRTGMTYKNSAKLKKRILAAVSPNQDCLN